MKAVIENGELVIRIPVNAPLENSKTGKTFVVASSHGNIQTDLEVEGQQVVIGVNAYIRKPKK